MFEAWSPISQSQSPVQPALSTPVSPLLDLPHRSSRWDLERHHPFSWPHCFISVLSYALMLSDVLRTGLGVKSLSTYQAVEPDHLIFFGPYAYPVVAELLKNETESSTITERFWPYKYDTTSLAMRAVAKHLVVPQWSNCITYNGTCDEIAGLSHSSLFVMIDALVEAVKSYKDTYQSHKRVGRFTLRIQYGWYDRLHDYAFPFFFSKPRHRTVQAHYFDLRKSPFYRYHSICTSPYSQDRPLTCDHSWINFMRLCTGRNPHCKGVGSVHMHIPTRLDELAAKYPRHTVDIVLLEGVDDFSRSSHTFQGSKFADVVVLARVRKCSGDGVAVCETIAVDDFRYEIGLFTTSVRHWFGITATIRALGQCYAWTRLLVLIVGCYVARAQEPQMQKRSLIGRAVLSVRTLFLLPSQVMVYGSLFPISCYLLAHLIDSAAVYELMGQQFFTLMGAMSLRFSELVRVCAVSMRSLWILAFSCHAFHWVRTKCAWSPIHGVLGIPEFSLSFVASLTILAQVRFEVLRHSNVLHVDELVTSPNRLWVQSEHSNTIRGFLSKLFFGTVIDYKCLAFSVGLHVAVVLLARAVNRVFPRCFPYQFRILTRTIVPFGADLLWPTGSLVVSWNGTFLAKPAPKTDREPSSKALSVVLQSFEGRRPTFRAITPFSSRRDTIKSTNSLELTAASEKRLAILHQSNRSNDGSVETLIYLMNLGVMTDPLTFLRLRVLEGQRIAVYRSRHTQRCILLPMALYVSSTNDIPIDWSDLELQFVVHTRDLEWRDLLHCG